MNHPNRRAFSGMLTFLDQASEKPPAGSRGHQILVSKEAAELALESLVGMGISCDQSLGKHNTRQKVGVIGTALIEGNELHIGGYIFGRDFPEVIYQLNACEEDLGLSYELHDARVANILDKVWRVTHFTFMGAAILKRDKAAYRGTWIKLDAKESK